jgi:hypothetical protein
MGPTGLRCTTAALAGRCLSVRCVAGAGARLAGGGRGDAGAVLAAAIPVPAEGVGAAGVPSLATASCSDRRRANWTRVYGAGAAGCLNFSFGSGCVLGHVGDVEPPKAAGLTAAGGGGGGGDAGAGFGDGRAGGGGRVRNSMRNLRVSFRSGRTAVGDWRAGSILTGFRNCSSPSLSSSMILVGLGSGRMGCRRCGTTGLVRVGHGPWFSIRTGGVAGFGAGAGAGVSVGGAGVGIGSSGAHDGAVSSRVW